MGKRAPFLKLGLTLAGARTPFYDAIRGAERFQIKGRAVDRDDRYRGRVPSIKCGGEFEAVLLVLIDRRTFEVIEIWKAKREDVARRLKEPGPLGQVARARNERNSMGITQFKSIATRVWQS